MEVASLAVDESGVSIIFWEGFVLCVVVFDQRTELRDQYQYSLILYIPKRGNVTLRFKTRGTSNYLYSPCSVIIGLHIKKSYQQNTNAYFKFCLSKL